MHHYDMSCVLELYSKSVDIKWNSFCCVAITSYIKKSFIPVSVGSRRDQEYHYGAKEGSNHAQATVASPLEAVSGKDVHNPPPPLLYLFIYLFILSRKL